MEKIIRYDNWYEMMTWGFSRLWVLIFACAFLVCLLSQIENGTAKTLTVDDDGGADFDSVQDAIDSSTDGDTVRVFDGVYFQNILVNKTLNLIGNGSASTIINGQEWGSVVTITASWVNVSGFTVTNSSWPNDGISVMSDHNTVTQMNCSGNQYRGIHLYKSNNCQITNNECNGSSNSGIYLDQSFRNIIRDNFCNFNGGMGIFLEKSDGNVIDNNECSHQDDSYSLSTTWGNGIRVLQSNEIIISNNLCNNNSAGIFLENSENPIIQSNICNNNSSPGIDIRTVTNGSVLNNYCKNNGWSGIDLDYSNHIIIRDCLSIEGNASGLRIRRSSDIEIDNSTFSNNYRGMSLIVCENIIVERSVVSGNRNNSFHIWDDSKNISIHNSSIHGEVMFLVFEVSKEHQIVNATHNNWGHDSGPYHPTNTMNGGGHEISDYVRFEPWLDENGNVVYPPDDDPDRFPFFILLGLLIGLITTLIIVDRNPQLLSSGKTSHNMKPTQSEQKWDSKDIKERSGNLITCQYCQDSFEVGEKEMGIMVACTHCGENTPMNRI